MAKTGMTQESHGQGVCVEVNNIGSQDTGKSIPMTELGSMSTPGCTEREEEAALLAPVWHWIYSPPPRHHTTEGRGAAPEEVGAAQMGMMLGGPRSTAAPDKLSSSLCTTRLLQVLLRDAGSL